MSRNLLDVIPAPIKAVGLGFLTAGILNNCAEFMEASGINETNAMISLGEMMLLDDDPKNDAAALQMISTYTRIYQKELAAASASNITTTVNVGSATTTPTPTTPPTSSLPENVIFRNGVYAPAPGYSWITSGDNGDFRVVKDKITPRLPENVILRDGKYSLAPGFDWLNPKDNSDLRTVKEKVYTPKETPISSSRSSNTQRTPNHPKGFFSGSKIFDYNGNKRIDKADISNFGRTYGSLGGDGLILIFSHGNPSRGEFVRFRTWNRDTGKYLGEYTEQMPTGTLKLFSIGNPRIGDPFNKNAENKLTRILEQAGPGKYKITAETGKGNEYSTNITLTK